MTITTVPVDKELYDMITLHAIVKFDKPESDFNLCEKIWISNEYVKHGGEYLDMRFQFTRECWVMIIPFVKSGRVTCCNYHERNERACLPLRRVTKHSHVTLPELMKQHSKRAIINMAVMKNKYIDKTVDWVNLKFY
jgi:hypothetical protein